MARYTTRRTRLGTSTASLALVCCASWCAACGSPADPPPPNVVLIVADDLGWGELGSYGQTLIRTPNIDRLAAQGMRFTQSYSGAPVCAPSRNVLMTGMHLGHVTIRSNRPATDENGDRVEGQQPIPAEALTIAEVFRSAGYATGAMGKWGLGPVGSTGDPNVQGFDHFYGYNCQAVAHSYFPPHLWDDAERVVINSAPVPGRAQQPEGEVVMEDWFAESYAPDLMLAEALTFIEDHREDPFFLYLPFIEPHVAMHPPRALVESYPEEWDERPYRGQSGYIPHPRPRAGYAAMITSLDEHVGAVMAKLEELELAGSTLVIFTSDNGTTHPHTGDPHFGVGGVDSSFFNSTSGLRGFKGSVYEGGLRVPLIARWPGHVEAGTVSAQPTYFPDLFATLSDLIGVGIPDHVDGISILPTLTGRGEQTERNPMVWVFTGYGGQVAVRFGDWKLVRRGLQGRDGPPGPWELYDLGVDVGERNDVAVGHPDRVEQGIAILREQISENELFPMTVPGVNDQL